MSQRLELTLDDAELEEIQRLAREQSLSAAEWVRQALRIVSSPGNARSSKEKLAVVSRAAKYSF